jgi:hypothetical protein
MKNDIFMVSAIVVTSLLSAAVGGLVGYHRGTHNFGSHIEKLNATRDDEHGVCITVTGRVRNRALLLDLPK